jgi:hypothetical protein
VSNLETAVNEWGTSSPCAVCGMWVQHPGGLAQRFGKPVLSEHGECPDCAEQRVGGAIRRSKLQAAQDAVRARAEASDPTVVWRRIIDTAVCYSTVRRAPHALEMACRAAEPELRALAAYRRAIRTGQIWIGDPPIVPADVLWRVFDAAVVAVAAQQIDTSALGRDLTALVQGTPRELQILAAKKE